MLGLFDTKAFYDLKTIVYHIFYRYSYLDTLEQLYFWAFQQ